MSTSAGLIECIVCARRFQISDFGVTYLFQERHCVACYMRKLHDDDACFGGWTPSDIGCSMLCLDARQCKMFGLGAGMVKKTLSDEKKAELLGLLKASKLRRSSRFNAEHPFTAGSIRRALFDKALAGTTREALETFCERIGSSYPVQMKIIKRGYGNGHIWEYHENSTGKIWIDFDPQAGSLLLGDKKVQRNRRKRTTRSDGVAK